MSRYVVAILVALTMPASFYSVHAQCAATDKIYIDPRLVPRRAEPTPQEAQAMLLHRNHRPADAFDQAILQQYFQKGQPIVVPYGTGKVLVHPTNPCIQQYIP
jgi:hypothetical protein